MDVISDVLNTLRFKGNIYIHSNFNGQWGAHFQAVKLPVFHCVLKGSCFIKSDQEKTFVELQAGDVSFLPHGISHTIANSPTTDCKEQVIEPGKICIKTNTPDELTETRLLCGVFQSEDDFLHPIFTTLPEFMNIPFSEDHQDLSWGQHAGFVIDNALHQQSAGLDVLIDRLYEILFIQILQKFYYNQSTNISFYSCHQQPRIKGVLTAIHANPEASWTLDGMADLAHMSRSTFTSQFRKIVGMSPMSYVTTWRLLKARFLVKTTGLPLRYIAHKVGFRSQSGLNKAFKHFFGSAPKNFRT